MSKNFKDLLDGKSKIGEAAAQAVGIATMMVMGGVYSPVALVGAGMMLSAQQGEDLRQTFAKAARRRAAHRAEQVQYYIDTLGTGLPAEIVAPVRASFMKRGAAIIS